MKRSVLYISYDGMLEPLGQSQVLAYLERLANDMPVYLLSFEKPDDLKGRNACEALRARMRKAGIRWHPKRYHKQPTVLATSWDIVSGIASCLWLVKRNGIGIVHARSYVPAMMALVLKRFTGVRFIFDMRGFWADERVDGGLWPAGGRLYQVAKWFERQFLLQADHIASLTHAAVREMERFDYLKNRMPPVTVIPTCADLNRFVPMAAPESGFVLGYVGSAGTWHLFDAVVASFVELRKLVPDARLLIINRKEHSYICDRLRAGTVPMDLVELRAADHADVPAQMARMRAGIFFYKPSYSRFACAPTKLGEFLGCGIPCLSNAGVGDMAEILEGERVGVAVDGFDDDLLRAGIERLLELTRQPDIETRCVVAARRHFSLDEGVACYRAIYHGLNSA